MTGFPSRAQLTSIPSLTSTLTVDMRGTPSHLLTIETKALRIAYTAVLMQLHSRMY